MWFLLSSQFTFYSLLDGTKGTMATLSAKQRAGVLLKSVKNLSAVEKLVSMSIYST